MRGQQGWWRISWPCIESSALAGSCRCGMNDICSMGCEEDVLCARCESGSSVDLKGDGELVGWEGELCWGDRGGRGDAVEDGGQCLSEVQDME